MIFVFAFCNIGSIQFAIWLLTCKWSCLDCNTPSRDFYAAIGAKDQPEWVSYRMAGKVLADFSKE